MAYKFVLGVAPANDNDTDPIIFTDPEQLHNFEIDNKIDEALEYEDGRGMLYLGENPGDDFNQIIEFDVEELEKITKPGIEATIREYLGQFMHRNG